MKAVLAEELVCYIGQLEESGKECLVSADGIDLNGSTSNGSNNKELPVG